MTSPVGLVKVPKRSGASPGGSSIVTKTMTDNAASIRTIMMKRWIKNRATSDSLLAVGTWQVEESYLPDTSLSVYVLREFQPEQTISGFRLPSTGMV